MPSSPALEAHVPVEGRIRLPAVVRFIGAKGRAGAVLRDGEALWRAARTPDGPVTMRLRVGTDGVAVQAWGPGSEAGLITVPGLVGALDDPSALVPVDPVTARLAKQMAGHRLTATGSVWEHIVPTVLGQKVPATMAGRAWNGIVDRWGEVPPGPAPRLLRLPPAPEVVAGLAYHDLHPFGVERKRAQLAIRLAQRANRLEEAAAMDPVAARDRLEAFPGIGVWTSALVTLACHGDPDAVIVGDYNIPAHVAWAYARERTADDERMLELLEPYRGQRARVQMWVKYGAPSPPRHGPRLNVPDIRRF